MASAYRERDPGCRHQYEWYGAKAELKAAGTSGSESPEGWTNEATDLSECINSGKTYGARARVQRLAGHRRAIQRRSPREPGVEELRQGDRNGVGWWPWGSASHGIHR